MIQGEKPSKSSGQKSREDVLSSTWTLGCNLYIHISVRARYISERLFLHASLKARVVMLRLFLIPRVGSSGKHQSCIKRGKKVSWPCCGVLWKMMKLTVE